MSNKRSSRHQSQSTSSRLALMSALEKDINSANFFQDDNFEEGDIETKMDHIIEAIKVLDSRFITIHQIVNDVQEGLDPRIDAAHDSLRDSTETVDGLKKENLQLRKELDILRNLLAKCDQEITQLRDKVSSVLTGKSMSSNITISGITEDCADKKQDPCKQKVKNLITDVMGISFKENHLQVVHRIGEYKAGSHRIVVAKCHQRLKSAILSSKDKLKDKKNEEGKKYYINTQIPDEWKEEKRERREIIKKAKDKAKEEGKEVNVTVHKGTVFVNNQPQRKFLLPPKTHDLFPDAAEQEKIDKVKLFHSVEHSKEGSSFTAFAVKCSSMTEICRAYVKVRQTFPDATHIPAAYSIKHYLGHQDDREFGEGHRILKLLTDNNISGVAIFVARYHDGPHIGPLRHELYKKAATEVLVKMKLMSDE